MTPTSRLAARLFADDQVDLDLLRQRAFNLRWGAIPHGVIPLTAADPDFPAAQEIRDALRDYVSSGVLSYGPPEGLPLFRESAARGLARRRGLSDDPAQIFPTDSVASGMRVVAQRLLSPGDEAIVFDPVDFLFRASVESAGASAVLSPIDAATGAIDLDALRRACSPRTRMLCLCNPHNPVGRVLDVAELRALGELAVERDLWILSDEIWSDIVYRPHRHVSIASLSPAIAARTFTLAGFSKGFALAGLRVGLVHAPSAALAASLVDASGARTTAYGVCTLSQVAAAAAWDRCDPWLDAFIEHLHAMRDLTVRRLDAMPGVRCRPPEGTYVAFPDVRAFGLGSEAVAEHLLRDARVGVVPGLARWFGPGAEGHIRLCFATSRAILTEALDRVEDSLTRLGRTRGLAR